MAKGTSPSGSAGYLGLPRVDGNVTLLEARLQDSFEPFPLAYLGPLAFRKLRVKDQLRGQLV